jgi:hypothetical protein
MAKKWKKFLMNKKSYNIFLKLTNLDHEIYAT